MTQHKLYVMFVVEADDDMDAESTLDYALSHAPLVSKENGVQVVAVSDTADALDEYADV